MNCVNEDTWVTIGDYQFWGHEGTLGVRYGKESAWYKNPNYNKWIGDFKIKNAETQRSDKYGHQVCIYGSQEQPDDIYVKCLSFYPVDWLGDLNDAFDYFSECGLYVKLSCKDFKRLLDFIGISSSTKAGSDEWGYESTDFDRYKLIKNYGIFRQKVLNRDNNECLSCGNKSDLEVHHIFSFKNHLELGDEVSNGATLCKNCHQEYHNKYGYDNANPIDLVEFIKNHAVR